MDCPRRPWSMPHLDPSPPFLGPFPPGTPPAPEFWKGREGGVKDFPAQMPGASAERALPWPAGTCRLLPAPSLGC